MTDHTAIRMAREIAANVYVGDASWTESISLNIRNGGCDDAPVVQAALTAILETTERAAKHADNYDAWCGAWGLDRNLNAAGEGASEVATALRNMEHIV